RLFDPLCGPSCGQPRPMLASQLDRLDRILDGLPESLQAAVRDAVEQAVAAAVHQAVSQAVPTLLTPLLQHPHLLHALHPGMATASPRAAAVRAAVRNACQRPGNATGAALGLSRCPRGTSTRRRAWKGSVDSGEHPST